MFRVRVVIGFADKRCLQALFKRRAGKKGPSVGSLNQVDGRRVIVHSCVLARAADLPDVYLTSVSFLANSSIDTNPNHTDETVYAMCMLSHWPLFSFQSQLLSFLFEHLYDKQLKSKLINPSFAALTLDPVRCPFPCFVFLGGVWFSDMHPGGVLETPHGGLFWWRVAC